MSKSISIKMPTLDIYGKAAGIKTLRFVSLEEDLKLQEIMAATALIFGSFQSVQKICIDQQYLLEIADTETEKEIEASIDRAEKLLVQATESLCQFMLVFLIRGFMSAGYASKDATLYASSFNPEWFPILLEKSMNGHGIVDLTKATDRCFSLPGVHDACL